MPGYNDIEREIALLEQSIEESRDEIIRDQQHKAQKSTLRDQFAMAALTGRIAVAAHPESGGPEDPKELSKWAYKCADEMLKARKK